MSILHTTVGQNIRQFRERLGFTQEVLAGYLNIARPLISHYETGERTVPTAHLTKLADLFGVDEYDLLEEDSGQRLVNYALAFRADSLTTQDLEGIATFRRIVKNYLKMKQVLANEKSV